MEAILMEELYNKVGEETDKVNQEQIRAVVIPGLRTLAKPMRDIQQAMENTKRISDPAALNAEIKRIQALQEPARAQMEEIYAIMMKIVDDSAMKQRWKAIGKSPG